MRCAGAGRQDMMREGARGRDFYRRIQRTESITGVLSAFTAEIAPMALRIRGRCLVRIPAAFVTAHQIYALIVILLANARFPQSCPMHCITQQRRI